MPSKRGYYQVLAFDPGGVTGWAHIVVNARAFMSPKLNVMDCIYNWATGELDGTEHDIFDAAINRIHIARYGRMPFLGNVEVVSEDFDLVQTRGSAEDLLSPVRFNAVIGYECEKKYALKLNLANRTLRMNVTAERLTLMGFDSPWYRGKWPKSGEGKDSFAAMQHAVAWLRRRKLDANQRPWKESAMDIGRFSYPLTAATSV